MPRGKHANHVRGSRHHRWNPRRIEASTGYVKVRVGVDHPLADPNGYAYEHLVIWCAAGHPRPSAEEILHHKNEDKTDNRYGNLVLKTRVAHGVEHQPTALTDEQVLDLRDRYARGEHTGILAKRFGIPQQTAWKIVRGKTRRSAGGPIQERSLRATRAGRLLDGIEHNGFPL